jgi:hypothetical protein
MFDGADNSVQGIFVAPRDLLRWADRIRPHVAKMAEGSGGRYEASDIFSAMATGRILLWIAMDGAEIACVMLTEIVQYPRRRAMRCIGISGSRPRRWIPLLAEVERAARERFECDLMEALHRPDHRRLLRTGGWREFHILSEKTL